MRTWILFAMSMAIGLLLVTRAHAQGARLAAGGSSARAEIPPRLLDDLKAARAQTFLEVARQRIDGARYDEAIQALREVEALTVDPELRFETIRCLVAMGKLKQATSAHQRYVASFRSPLDRLLAAARFGELLPRTPAVTPTSSPARALSSARPSVSTSHEYH